MTLLSVLFLMKGVFMTLSRAFHVEHSSKEGYSRLCLAHIAASYSTITISVLTFTYDTHYPGLCVGVLLYLWMSTCSVLHMIFKCGYQNMGGTFSLIWDILYIIIIHLIFIELVYHTQYSSELSTT